MEQEDYLLDIFIDLDMFSRLSANTSVHLDSNNHFVITARNMSYIPGAQTLANYYNSHSTEKLIKDLDVFAKKIVDVLKLEFTKTENPDTKNQSIKIIRLVYKEFKLAYNGLSDTLDGGMRGLLMTLRNDVNLPDLISTFEFLKTNLCNLKKDVDELDIYKSDINSVNPLYCPEADFTDDDWIRMLQIIPQLQKEYTGIYKYYVNYASGLTLNQIISNPLENWWDEICQFQNGSSLFLGALPIINHRSNRNDLIALKDLGIGAVLSVVEVFENNSAGYIYSPVTPTDWRNVNIYHYQTPSPDLCSIEFETVKKAVEFIRWNILNRRKIYVHCKSGKSRSLFVIAVLFVIYYGYSVDDAISYIKSRRIQVGFGKNSKKMTLLREIELMVKKKA